MPWSSGKEFASRHNHALHGEAASKAASIANAILKRSGDDGLAIATANKYAASHRANGGASDISAALRIAHRDVGGFTPPSPPYFERQEESAIAHQHPYGFTAGVGGGRTDKNNVTLGSGSYVLPADVVAGLGDGNSLAGADVWNKILGSMPYGVTPPKAAGHRGPPQPPHDAQLMQGITGTQKEPIAPALAAGGEAEGVPIKSADGEVLISPEDVARVGHFYAPDHERGDPAAVMRRGHRVLDGFVKHIRGQTIRHLRSLPGPVGSKDAGKGHI